jgi:hypothetical protein
MCGYHIASGDARFFSLSAATAGVRLNAMQIAHTTCEIFFPPVQIFLDSEQSSMIATTCKNHPTKGGIVVHNEEKIALSRRAFVGKVAAGAAVAVVAGVGSAKALQTRADLAPGNGNEPPDGSHALPPVEPQQTSEASSDLGGPPPWELLRPLALGAVVSHGWRVAGLTGVIDGSSVLTLQNERGRSHRIHICRNDGSPQGLVYTNRLDLVVMNGGQGDLPTEEGLAQAVAEVAHVLAANERDGRHQSVMGALLPQAERVRLFTAAARLR